MNRANKHSTHALQRPLPLALFALLVSFAYLVPFPGTPLAFVIFITSYVGTVTVVVLTSLKIYRALPSTCHVHSTHRHSVAN